MCIIAIKGYKVDYPSTQRVRTMCDNNPHGFAMAYYTKDKGVRIYRTMDERLFIDEYEKVKAMHHKDDIAMYIHARISTHGSTTLKNCHGWKDDDIGVCFAHNGILRIANRDDMTDSETFFRDIFVPAFSIGGWVAAERSINAIIGSSKFVFLDSLGCIHYYGHYIHDKDGCLYSNGTYLDWDDCYGTLAAGEVHQKKA